MLYLHSVFEKIRALSSVGSEHLPYKQGVTGSNPVGPTNEKASKKLGAFFVSWHQIITGASPIAFVSKKFVTYCFSMGTNS